MRGGTNDPAYEDWHGEVLAYYCTVGEQFEEYYLLGQSVGPERIPAIEALTGYDAVWGGSYLDESGRFVVWLTEDTEQNRAEVFARNPSLDASSVVFKTADYSLAYLTDLMTKISKAMSDGELPFVSSAALMESTNRIEVRVSDDSADLVEKVLALDTLGGAIEIRLGSMVYG